MPTIPQGPCSACEGLNQTDILSHEQIQEYLQQLNPLSRWIISEDGKILLRQFVCKNWQAAINAILEISKVAEDPNMQHHPDLHLTNYREVEIKIYTHSVGGLTAFDFKLALEIDKLSFDYSPKWLKSFSV